MSGYTPKHNRQYQNLLPMPKQCYTVYFLLRDCGLDATPATTIGIFDYYSIPGSHPDVSLNPNVRKTGFKANVKSTLLSMLKDSKNHCLCNALVGIK